MQDNTAIPAQTLDRLIAAHDGDVALLWLYRLKNPDGDLEDAARALCRTIREIEAAAEKLSRLETTGVPVIVPPKPEPPPPAPADESPEYTAKDIAARSREDPRFAAIVTEAQRVLGRLLSTGDLKKLFGLYDYLALPPEVLMMLLNYCVSLYPTGSPPSMRQIEKEGYVWANREILTLEQAEEYIAASSRKRDELSRAARVLGITGRALSGTETKFLTAWLDMGFDEELIELAYEKTITNTGGLKWGYMNGILKSWHEKGLHTPADVRDKDARRAGGKSPNRTEPPKNLGALIAALDDI